MSPEKLHFIIQGLTKGQKIAFRNWVRGSAGEHREKKPLYLVLYERLQKLEVYDEKKVRGEEFKSSRSFLKHREQLFEKLLAGLSTGFDSEGRVLSHIKVALKLGAIANAKKMFQLETQTAFQQSYYDYFKRLMAFRKSVFLDFRVELLDSMSRASVEALEAHLIKVERLINTHQRVLKTLYSSREKKKSLILELEVLLEDIHPGNPVEKYWMKKMEIDKLYLEGKYDYAHQVQLDISFGVESKVLICSPAQQIREYASGIISSFSTGNRDSAIFFAMKLSSWEPESNLERRMKIRQWTFRSIEAGNALFDLDFANQGLERLLENDQFFFDKEVVKYLYFSALTYLSVGEFSFGLKCITKIEEFPSKAYGELTWQPDVLKSVLLFELGEIRILENQLRTSKRKANSTGYVFPILVIDSINILLQNNTSKGLQFLKTRLKENLQSLNKDPDEARQAKFFNLELWIESKIKNRFMSKCDFQDQDGISQLRKIADS